MNYGYRKGLGFVVRAVGDPDNGLSGRAVMVAQSLYRWMNADGSKCYPSVRSVALRMRRIRGMFGVALLN